MYLQWILLECLGIDDHVFSMYILEKHWDPSRMFIIYLYLQCTFYENIGILLELKCSLLVQPLLKKQASK